MYRVLSFRLSLTDSEVKKTPYQMRKEEGGNIFLTSCEEKLNLLKEKQNGMEKRKKLEKKI